MFQSHKIITCIAAAATVGLLWPGEVAARKKRVTRQGVAATQPVAAKVTADSATLHQTMILERDFAPIVRDANKIDRRPAIDAPTVAHTVATYADWTATTSQDSAIQILPVGQVFDPHPFDTHRGYLDANFGNYTNINLLAGYRILDDSTNQLKVNAGYHLTQGKLTMNRTHADGYKLPDWKSFATSGNAAADYKRHAERATWSAGVSYDFEQHNLLNFNLHNPYEAPILPKVRQKTQDLRVLLGVDNAVDHAAFNYDLDFAFETFTLHDPDATELRAHLHANLFMSDSVRTYGTAFEFTSLGYRFDHKTDGADDPLKSGVQVTLRPYYKFNIDNVRLNLGLRADVISGSKNHVAIAPAIQAAYAIHGGNNELYADLLGGMTRASQHDMMTEMPFYIPTYQYKNPWQIFDATVGFRSSNLGNFRGGIFAGAAYTQDALVPITIYNSRYGMTTALRNVDNMRIKMGGNIDYTYNKYFAASADLTFYANSKSEADSYRPTTQLGVHLYSRPTRPLLLEVYLKGEYDRKVWRETSGGLLHKAQLEDVSNLGLKGSWAFSDHLSFYATFDNLLCQKYDVWLGVPAQQFNFHLGGTYLF